jgi:phosphatidylglycerophosphatase A
MSGRKVKVKAAHVGSPVPSVAQRIATLGGLGGVGLAPGTVGSLVGAGLCLPLLRLGWPLHLAAALLLTAVAVLVSGRVAEEVRQPDPPGVIIDEVVGMWVAALALPLGWYDLGAVFLLFRIFDVIKPAPMPRLERLPGGFGIVADDVAAGLLARFTWWLLKVNFDFL